MYIERYTVQVRDVYTNKAKKIIVDANTAVEAHLKALNHCNQLTQDIIKIANYDKKVVYTLEDGFKEQ